MAKVLKKNVGQTDKLIRVIFALIFFIMGALYSPLWMAVSLVLLFTAMTGHCAPYLLFGINTCEVKGKGKKSSSKSD